MPALCTTQGYRPTLGRSPMQHSAVMPGLGRMLALGFESPTISTSTRVVEPAVAVKPKAEVEGGAHSLLSYFCRCDDVRLEAASLFQTHKERHRLAK